MNKAIKATVLAAVILIVLGIMMALIGLGTGGLRSVTFGPDGLRVREAFAAGDLKRISQQLDPFKNISVDVDLSCVTLKEGGSFRIDGNYVGAYGMPEISVENGTLTVKEQYNRDSRPSWLSWLGRGDYRRISDLKLEIQYPAGTRLGMVQLENDAADLQILKMSSEAIYVNCDAGSVKLEQVVTDRLEVDVDAGECNLTDVKSAYVELSLDAGSLKARNFSSNGMEASLSMGQADIEGTLRGHSRISADMGNVLIKTDLPESEYGYEIDVQMGNVTVNGSKRSGSALYNRDNNKPNYIRVDADMGNVELDFSDR